ncbi:MAG TPA: cytochrome c biogenesis protein CcdA [Pseudonocardiaceae bacterium]|nr:cytochrome c biogenesis protein CcdA [Pseudonocardiaceae bacterium]
MAGGISYAIAFGGGVVSFLSPCVLPLVPVYLSITTGIGVTELAEGGRSTMRAVAKGTGLFVAGFSLVFIALGLSVTVLGATLLRNQAAITRISGVVVIAMAVVLFVGTVLHRGWFVREARFHLNLSRYGPWAAPLAGAAFAFGWTPCIGPVLGSVLAIAATENGVARGGLLLAVYSAGLAVPFMITGLAFQRVVGAMSWTKRHSVAIVSGSAILLGAFGLLLVLNQLTWLTLHLQTTANAVGLGWLVTLG